MKALSLISLVSLLTVSSLNSAYSSERTPTGFFYPTGRAPKSGDTGWLASDANYFDGKCHIGYDFIANLNDSVYPIGDGEIVTISLNGWGDNNVGFLVKHKLAIGIEFMALYGHVQANNLKATDKVYAEVPFGKIGYWSFGNHLHFGILPSLAYPSGTWGAMPSPCQYPYNGFVDPINWITTEIPKANGLLVGQTSSVFVTDTMSQAFIDTFCRHSPKIGWPVNYVHKWTSTFGYRVYLQDFQGDMSANAEHFGWNGQTAIIYNNINDGFRPPAAYLVREGMWDYYRNHDGPANLGEPFTEEITLRYATNASPSRTTDTIKGGDQITVQKFNLVKDGYGGLPLYENQRRTLVYNNTRGSSVFPFAVG